MILAQRFNAGSGVARVLRGATAERPHDFSPAFQRWVGGRAGLAGGRPQRGRMILGRRFNAGSGVARRAAGADARPYIDSSKREPV